MKRPIKAVAVVLFLTLAFGNSQVFGCSCIHAAPEELVDEAEHVFVAQITSANLISIYDEEQYFRVHAKFEATEVLKGDPSKIKQLVGGLGFGDCSVPITVGHHLLVQTDDSGVINICSGTRVAFPWVEEWNEYLQGVREYIGDGTPIPDFDFEEWEY